MRFILVAFALLLPLVAASELSENARDELANLIIYTDQYPPYNFVENGELSGFSVDLLRRVYQQLDIPLPAIQVLPWTRAYKLVHLDTPAMLFSTARTSEREELFQWVGPIYRSAVLLVTWQGSGIDQYDPGVQQNEPIVAVRSDISRLVLDEHNYPPNQIREVDTSEQQYLLFIKKRIPLASVSQVPFEIALAEANEPGLEPVELHVMRRTEGYYAFNLAVSAEAINAVQNALNEIASEHENLLKEYNLSLK